MLYGLFILPNASILSFETGYHNFRELIIFQIIQKNANKIKTKDEQRIETIWYLSLNTGVYTSFKISKLALLRSDVFSKVYPVCCALPNEHPP